MRGMVIAGISNENCPLCYSVSRGAIRSAHVDAVLVVETPADGVSLNHDIAHSSGVDWWMVWWVLVSLERRSGGEVTVW